MDAIDIVVTTHARPDCLRRTLEHIRNRTEHKCRLLVIDDASLDMDTAPYLYKMWATADIDSLILLGENCGAMAAQNIGIGATFSDPVVLVDDDVLCPQLDPCWLTQAAAVMEARPNLAMLALRHPGAKVKVYRQDDKVGYCRSIGATFALCRREFLREHPLPHELGRRDKPMERRCTMAYEDSKWEIGVIRDVFCYHIGADSVLTGKQYKGKVIGVKSWGTLEPKETFW